MPLPLWHLIESGERDSFYNMALDEAIAASVRAGVSPPTLRLYGWDRPSVSMGCFQKAEELDLAYLEKENIPLVRRPTGGRGILHGRELTYSFSAPTKEGLFSSGLFDSYMRLAGAFSKAFSRVGLSTEIEHERRRPGRTPLCFESASYGEITVGGKKVIGSAQRRWQGALLQQGSIPYAIDYAGQKRIFGDAGEVASNHMCGLSELITPFNPDAFKEAVKASFEESFGVRLVPAPPALQEALQEALEEATEKALEVLRLK